MVLIPSQPQEKRRGKWVDLLTWKPGMRRKVVVACETALVLGSHWVGKSILCLATDDCPLCAVGCGQQAQIYFAGLFRDRPVLARTAFSSRLQREICYGATLDITLLKGAGGYQIQRYLEPEPAPPKVPMQRILLRATALHGLKWPGSGDFDSLTVEEVLERVAPQAVRLAEAGAERYLEKCQNPG